METEIAIVGGGVMGLSAAWRVATSGRSVALFERFGFGHDRGSSHGPTRIFRFTYDHPRYVAMARAALPIWRELEAVPHELLRITGGIDAGDPAALQRCAEALAAEGARFRWLAGEEIGERYPWCALTGPVLESPDTGVIKAAGTLARLRERATEAGAQLVEHNAVRSIGVDESGVTLDTEQAAVRARTIVVAAGAWTGPMLGSLGIHVPLRVTNEHVFYVDGPADTVPVIWRRERFFYTVPAFEGAGPIKIGEHVGGDEVDPDRRETAPPPRTDALAGWARATLPSFSSPGARGDTCLYTITPDEDFIIDRRGPVIVVSACSGHGFKFAPLIGELVARIVAGSDQPVSIDAFGFSRF